MAMDDLFNKHLGLGEDADPAAVRAAFKAFLTKYDKHLASAAEKAAEDKEPEKMAEPLEGKETPEEEKAEKKEEEEKEGEEFKALARAFNLDPELPRRVLLSTVRSTAIAPAQFDAIRAEARTAARAEVEAESRASAAKAAGEEMAARAVKFGMKFDSDAARADFVAFAATSPASAENVIKSLPGARLMGRITTAGAPVGAKPTVQPEQPESAGGVRIMGRGLAGEAKRLLAEGKAKNIAEAQVMAIRSNPALGAE